MRKSHKDSLSRYVKRIMEDKHLSQRDVRLMSEGKITESYISGIINGTATNLTIDKLKALARGLGVPDQEVVRAAFDLQENGAGIRTGEKSDSLVLVDLSKKIVVSPDITEIVRELVTLPAEGRAEVLKVVRSYRGSQRRRNRSGA